MDLKILSSEVERLKRLKIFCGILKVTSSFWQCAEA
jgi:hypothetical protein